MPQCGEIVVERLTGNRAMVIRLLSPEEVTCRFGDGRLEDRFSFELEPLLSLRDPRGGGRFVPLGPLVWLFLSGFVNRWFQQGAAASVTDRLRLVRPSESSRSPLAVWDRRSGAKNEMAWMAKADEPVAQLATRIPKELHRRLKLHCVTHDTSVMEFVVEAIQEKLGRKTRLKKGPA